MAYAKIDNLYKTQDILLFKECYALEKIHGCLEGRTNILLSNMSIREISKLVKHKCVGEELLGVDDNGNVVPSKILAVHDNGITEDWLDVKGERRGIGRGRSYFRLQCTPNHEFFTPDGYIPAGKLSPGKIVYLIRSELEITPLQQQVLLGILLGDGSIKVGHSTATVSFSHKRAHEEYVNFTMKALGWLAHRTRPLTSGYGTDIVDASTVASFFIHKHFSSFIKEGRKTVPLSAVDQIGPIALAFLFMDDGSLGHHKDQEDRAHLALCNFDREECGVIQKSLAKFGIGSEYYYSGPNMSHSRIRVNADDAERLFLLISPYVPPCMQYKLPSRYRGASQAWLPEDRKCQYKKCMVEQKITSVNKVHKRIRRFDLTTETGNFFANYILVHNSSAHIGWNGEKIHYFAGGASHKLFVELFNEEELVAKFAEKLGNQKVVVYGEAYGGKIMGMKNTYGSALRFVAFDVKIGDVWLAVPQAEALATNLGLEFVHYAKVPTDLESLNRERDADSVQAIRNGMGPGKMREGIILRPLMELRKNNDERIVVKHKRDEFRETQEKRFVETDPEKLKILDDANKIADEWCTPMRLVHILDKLPHDENNPLTPERTPEVIEAMRKDVCREGAGEFVDSKEVTRAIGKKAASLYIQHLKSQLKEE